MRVLLALVAVSAIPIKLMSDAVAYRVEQRGLDGLRGLGGTFYVEGPIGSFL
jgi:hypothetical protein